jgi:hypothetical protein
LNREPLENSEGWFVGKAAPPVGFPVNGLDVVGNVEGDGDGFWNKDDPDVCGNKELTGFGSDGFWNKLVWEVRAPVLNKDGLVPVVNPKGFDD